MTAALQLNGVVKSYSGLRPLRITALEVQNRERVAIGGLDAAAAELIVNLITGATLPDQGVVVVFGRSTADIATGDDWLGSLDRFGIVSPRAVMLEAATVEQNLAMPFTLQIDPIPPTIVEQVRALATASGIGEDFLRKPIGEAPPHVRARAHLARAVALDPQLLLLEHPSADLDAGHRAGFARDVARAADGRRLTTVAITMDEEFAAIVAHRSLTLNGATGQLVPWKKKKRWWS